MSEYEHLLGDIEAERQALVTLLAGTSDDDWALPTPAPGWAIRDQIYHLLHYDEVAVMAMQRLEAFIVHRDAANADPLAYEAEHLLVAARQRPHVLYRRWIDASTDLLDALRSRAASDRIEWFGPSMSAMSFATARMMEYWAHGDDIAQALRRPLPPTERLRHVCHLGWITRSWSHRLAGLQQPEEDVRLELRSPQGAAWAWGSEDALDRVVGSACDFALVVTQRLALVDSDLVVTGSGAATWLRNAQAFAGPKGSGRSAGFPRIFADGSTLARQESTNG